MATPEDIFTPATRAQIQQSGGKLRGLLDLIHGSIERGRGQIQAQRQTLLAPEQETLENLPQIVKEGVETESRRSGTFAETPEHAAARQAEIEGRLRGIQPAQQERVQSLQGLPRVEDVEGLLPQAFPEDEGELLKVLQRRAGLEPGVELPDGGPELVRREAGERTAAIQRAQRELDRILSQPVASATERLTQLNVEKLPTIEDITRQLGPQEQFPQSEAKARRRGLGFIQQHRKKRLLREAGLPEEQAG